MDVLSLYWKNEKFRLAFNAYCVRQPPIDHTWLIKYYKAFRAEDPAQAIADTIDLSQNCLIYINTYNSKLPIHCLWRSVSPMYIV